MDDVAKSTAHHIAGLLNKSESGNASLNGKKIKPSDIAVLCKSRPQMIMVKNALADCNVPAVVSGSENVFASDEAKELVNLLSAVAAPFNQKAIKTALATPPIFGYTAEQIHNLTETDEWDEITEEFRTYNDLININGFAPMFFHMASRRRLYRSIAGMQNGGERKLTNYIHITELAQRHEADKKAAPIDLLNWMKESIHNSKDRIDEAELKMDSDDNAVTIITIHKSKGLEYNIVYTPPFFIFNKSRSNSYYKYHADDNYILDLAGSASAEEASEHEKKAEDIRIAYVALTRAKSVCYTAWGGNATGSQSSAIHYLTDGYSPSFFNNKDVCIKKFPSADIQTYTASKQQPEIYNKSFGKSVPSPWQINSFSRLIHSSSAVVKDTDQYTKPDRTAQPVNKFDIFAFPKGAKAGTCLHECMEDTLFESCSKAGMLNTVADKLELFSFDEGFVPAVADNLMCIIEKDMQGGIKLADLKAGKYIHEMEFQISTDNFTSEGITKIFMDNGGETDLRRHHRLSVSVPSKDS